MVDLNSKGRTIHKGPRGGEYVLQGGRKVYKFTRASGAPPPPRRASPPRRVATPPKPGYTKTPYTNVLSGLSVYRKESSGRHHVRGPPAANGKEPYGSISLDHRVRNASGTIKKLREWLGKDRTKKPRTSAAPPRSPNYPGHRKTLFKARIMAFNYRVYKERSSGQYKYFRQGTFHLTRPNNSWVSPSGEVKTAREWLPSVFTRRAPPPPPPRRAPPPPPPPRRAPSPPRSAVVNYEAMLKRNTSRLDMAKIRRYARNWLGKNIAANASYKRAALVIHPDKGVRTNAVNQAKRVALFKLLGGLK